MNQHSPVAFPSRLYSLDVVRGLAALSIVVFHWMHFFCPRVHSNPSLPVADLPFYSILFVLYQDGDMVVDLFFVLSGFVFYWLYSEKIVNRSVGLRSFLVLRFSRLYPLHFATLLLVLLLQFLYQQQTGSAFIYPHNDPYHFGLQLGFASEWGFQSGHSFNGPIWSVSVEILLYAIFFTVCAFRLAQPWHLAVLCLLGLVAHKVNGPVGQGIFGFFIGGLTFFLARSLLIREMGKVVPRAILAFCVLAWVATVVCVKVSLLAQITASLQEIRIGGFSDRMIAAVCSHAGKKVIVGGLFPLTILSLVLIEAQRGHLGKRIAILGDVSYSSYLLHFPLQLLIVTVFACLNWSTDVFRQGWTLIAFYAVLIPLSVFVFRSYERPSQTLLRKLLLPDQPKSSCREACASPSVKDNI